MIHTVMLPYSKAASTLYWSANDQTLPQIFEEGIAFETCMSVNNTICKSYKVDILTIC